MISMSQTCSSSHRIPPFTMTIYTPLERSFCKIKLLVFRQSFSPHHLPKRASLSMPPRPLEIKHRTSVPLWRTKERSDFPPWIRGKICHLNLITTAIRLWKGRQTIPNSQNDAFQSRMLERFSDQRRLPDRQSQWSSVQPSHSHVGLIWFGLWLEYHTLMECLFS